MIAHGQAITDPDPEEQELLKRRAIGLAVAIGALFLFLAGYLFFLQVVRGFEFRMLAVAMARRETTIPAPRGEIFDRTYTRPVVANHDVLVVDLIPGEVPKEEFPALMVRLAAALDLSEEELAQRVPLRMRHLYRAIELKRGVDFATIAALAERIEHYPGVTWRGVPARGYEQLGSLAHVVGYVGGISREELQVLFNQGYAADSTIGKSGVEKQYEAVLRGVDGISHRTVDVRERAVSEVWQTAVAPQPGVDVVLTIDRRVQRIAEQALGPRIGSVVVLQPSTGALLALVSYPWYDPGTFTGSGGAAAFRAAALDPSFPFINRAIRSVYAPASVFKIAMTAAVVEEGTFTPDHTINCRGSFAYGDRIFKDWIEEGHGPIELEDALAQSCDVYYYKAGAALGIERIAHHATGFGLGRATGIDLPGEAAGSVPTPSWKRAKFNAGWVGGDTINLSIGQGYIAVTPLQIANLVAMVANDGVIYRPHVVKETRDRATGAILTRTEPEPIHTSALDDATLAIVRRALRGVVTRGTAAVVITTDAVEVAGKTGTGEIGVEDHYHSWFAAYGPYAAADPAEQVVVVVMVEAANEWEWWAPKAANLIFHAMFADQTVAEAVAYLRPWYADGVVGLE